MKTTLPLTRRPRTQATVRRQLLAQFQQSGLCAAEFARQHGIGYSTFQAWRRQELTQPQIRFAEVQWVDGPALEGGLVVELGRKARLRLSSADQLGLAAALLQRWEAMC